MKTKASRGRKAPGIVTIHLLPASTHVLTPRHWSCKQPLAAAGSTTGGQRLQGDACLLALRCRRPQLPVQGRLCSQLTAAVASSQDVAAERLLGEKAASPLRDQGSGSCWGQAGEPPAAPHGAVVPAGAPAGALPRMRWQSEPSLSISR